MKFFKILKNNYWYKKGFNIDDYINEVLGNTNNLSDHFCKPLNIKLMKKINFLIDVYALLYDAFIINNKNKNILNVFKYKYFNILNTQSVFDKHATYEDFIIDHLYGYGEIDDNNSSTFYNHFHISFKIYKKLKEKLMLKTK